MTLIAIFFPFLSFFLRGRIFTAIICFILQITLIGWIPAAVWAVISLQNDRADRRNDKLIRAMKNKN
ncbi:MAG: YqaE/Pmp3 family membrane protein [Ferruginibacter sp.]